MKQGKKLKSHFSTMTRIARNVLNIFYFEIVNERLFFIINRIYESHKSYYSTTIRVKMIIRQHDYKKNEVEFDDAHFDLKEKKISNRQKFEEECNARDEILNKSNCYINNVDENENAMRKIYYISCEY